MMKETVLATIDGSEPHERLVFAAVSDSPDKPIVLRRETYSPAVGWFIQSRIEMSRQEMVLLRSAMGGQAHSACQQTQMRTAAMCKDPSSEPADEAMILSFDSFSAPRPKRPVASAS